MYQRISLNSYFLAGAPEATVAGCVALLETPGSWGRGGEVEVKLKPNECLEKNRRELLIDGPCLRLRSQKIHPFERKRKDFSYSAHSLHSVWKLVRNRVGPGQAVAGVWC